MKIRVEQRHINAGKPRDAFNCPIALAIKEELHVDNVSVTGMYIHMINNNMRYSWDRIPIKVTNFIQKVDYGKPVEPFEFEMKGLWVNTWA